MKTDIIKWNKKMAERCIRRAARGNGGQKKIPSAPGISVQELSQDASWKVQEQKPVLAVADHWDEFEKEMDQLLKG